MTGGEGAVGASNESRNDVEIILSSPSENRWPRLVTRHRSIFRSIAWLNGSVPGIKGRLKFLLVPTRGGRVPGSSRGGQERAARPPDSTN